MALNGDADVPHLLVRSGDETFPEEALEEIRRERLLGSGEDVESAALQSRNRIGRTRQALCRSAYRRGNRSSDRLQCTVHTGSLAARDQESGLLANQPVAIAENRQAGCIGDALLARTRRTYRQRSAPGHIVCCPTWIATIHHFRASAGRRVEERFEKKIFGRALLLTEGGNLVPQKQSVAVPRRLFDIWPDARAVAKLVGCGQTGPVQACRKSGPQEAPQLGAGGANRKVRIFSICLLAGGVPKPDAWERLLRLWAYVAPDIGGYRFRSRAPSFHIVPVHGQDALHSADKICSFG